MRLRFAGLLAGMVGCGSAQAASLPADVPPTLQQGAVQVAPAPGQVVLSPDQQARLHALLKQYGLGCGNPNCPYCRGLPSN
jgi:hypothetical protein